MGADFGAIRLRRYLPTFTKPLREPRSRWEVVFPLNPFNGEIEMKSTLSASYVTQYNTACERMDFMLKSLAERPSRAMHLAIDAGGADALQALFDAVMDRGHREVLVQALNSAALPQWVRDKLETFLYGNSTRTCALFQRLH